MPSISVPLAGTPNWKIVQQQRREFYKQPKNNKLSANFKADEFYCNDGAAPPIVARPAMVRLCTVFLEPMRKKFGTCFINSAYRHKLYNAKIGGVPNSQHEYEQTYESVATDVHFEKGSPAQWAAEARRIRTTKNKGKGGVGRYDHQGFVHIDNRAYKADWSG